MCCRKSQYHTCWKKAPSTVYEESLPVRLSQPAQNNKLNWLDSSQHPLVTRGCWWAIVPKQQPQKNSPTERSLDSLYMFWWILAQMIVSLN